MILNLKKKKGNSLEEVFSTDVYDSIINDRNNEDLEDILNINDVSNEIIDKMAELISEIEKNDNNNNDKDNTNIYLNNNGNHNQYHHPQNNNIMNKKKLMISSFLGRNNNSSSNAAFNSVHNNSNNSEIHKCYYENSNHHNHNNNNNNNSNISNNQIPLTDRPISNNKSSNYISKPPQSRQFCKTKMISDYSNTVFISNNNYTNQRILKNTQGISKGEINNIPLTYRQQHHSNDFPINNPNDYERKRERDHPKQSNIKTPPKYTNNFIYIINQNPKFTTNVTLFHNDSTTNTSIKAMTSRRKEDQHSKERSINIQSQLGLKEQHRPSSKNCIHNPSYYLEHQTSRNRNCLINNYTMKTTKEVKNNLLRTTSQVIIPHKVKETNFYCSKYKFKKTTSSRPISSSKQNNSTIHQHQHEQHQQSSNGEIMTQRADSLTKKLSFANNNNMKSFIPKQKMKGIHIKNFSKAFGLNCSNANSNRIEQNNC